MIGKNIKKFRESSHLTQDELAEKLFVTRQAVSNWENGKTQPDIETLEKIAEILNISVGGLIMEHKAPTSAGVEVLNPKGFDELTKIKDFLDEQKAVVLNLEKFGDAILDYMKCESIITPENHRYVEKNDASYLIMPTKQAPNPNFAGLDFTGIEVLTPKSFDELKKMKDYLQERKVVILNFEAFSDAILDYMKGESIVTEKNNVLKINNNSFVIAPNA